jgi:multicomponent Na+:H+ antiporter subunit D
VIEQLPALIVILPLLGGALAPILVTQGSRWVRWSTLCFLIATVFCATAAFTAAVATGPIHYKFAGWAPPWGIEFVIDPLSGMMAVLVSVFSLLGIFGLQLETLRAPRSRLSAFYALYMLATTGLLGISVTGDMFNLYVFLEVSALATYALVAAGGNRAKVAAYRYLIIGSVAASFWVIGLGYLYALTGTLNMADLASNLLSKSNTPALAAGMSFIIAGLVIKMALFPGHGWQPDAYSYAPPAVMPLVSSVMPKVSAYVLLRMLYWVFTSQGGGSNLMLLAVLKWTAAASILFGSFMALRQANLRRILAYSSIGQIGYVVFGIALGTPLALTGALLHLINHAVMKGAMFMAAAGMREHTKNTELGSLKGLAQRMPWTCGIFTLCALGMIGLPPTCGFFSKFYLLRAALESGEWAFVIILGFSSLLSTVYFFRIIETLYLKEGHKATPREASAVYMGPLLVLGSAVLGLGLLNQTLVDNVITPAIPKPGNLEWVQVNLPNDI